VTDAALSTDTSVESVSVNTGLNDAVTAILAGMAEGEWYEFPGSTLNASAAKWTGTLPAGSLGIEGIMSGFSGGVYDKDNHQLYIHGGGHVSYLGNEAYAFNVLDNANSGSDGWRRLNNPDSTNPPPAGKPNSVHTYNGLIYDSSRGWLVRIGGSVNGLTGGFADQQHWRLDVNAPFPAPWVALATTFSSDLNGDFMGQLDLQMIHDIELDQIRVLGLSGATLYYDFAVDDWFRDSFGYNEQTVPDNVLAFNPLTRQAPNIGLETAQNRLVHNIHADNVPNAWVVNSTPWNSTGDKIIEGAKAPGFIYQQNIDRFVAYDHNDRQAVYFFDLPNKIWTRRQGTGVTVADPSAPEPTPVLMGGLIICRSITPIFSSGTSHKAYI